jgi:hypothetical protein
VTLANPEALVVTETELVAVQTLAPESADSVEVELILEASLVQEVIVDSTFSAEVIHEIAVGPPGPAATPIEENPVYATRVDFINDDLLYRGEAAVGSNNASPLWRIRRIIIGVDGDITEEWSGGSAAFNKVWDDRLAGVYI